MIFRLLVMAALAAIGLSACSQDVVEKAASAISEDQTSETTPQAKSAENDATTTKSGGVGLPEGFPTESVPILDALVLSATHETSNQWTVLMESAGDADLAMDAAADLLGEAGFTADGIQAETISQWTNDAFAVTLVITPLDGDDARCSITYSVTQL